MPRSSTGAGRRALLQGTAAILAQPLLAACAIAAPAGATAPRCVLRPSQTEGPFFVEERLARADIRSDPTDGSVRPGAPLRLRFLVSHHVEGACQPASGVMVDVWHCDASGVYSEVDARGRPTPDGHAFLRGYQFTDEAGRAEFLTIYPGWYPGRTVHIHFKLRTAPDRHGGAEFTSQLYFDDALTDAVHGRPPYAHRGQRDTRNREDGIFRRGGEQLMLAPRAEGEGYVADFEVALPG